MVKWRPGENWTLLSPTLTANWLPSPSVHHLWLEFELLGEGRSGPQTMSAKTLGILDSNPTIDSIESPFVLIYVRLRCCKDCGCINTTEKRLRMRVIRVNATTILATAEPNVYQYERWFYTIDGRIRI